MGIFFYCVSIGYSFFVSGALTYSVLTGDKFHESVSLTMLYVAERSFKHAIDNTNRLRGKK